MSQYIQTPYHQINSLTQILQAPTKKNTSYMQNTCPIKDSHINISLTVSYILIQLVYFTSYNILQAHHTWHSSAVQMRKILTIRIKLQSRRSLKPVGGSWMPSSYWENEADKHTKSTCKLSLYKKLWTIDVLNYNISILRKSGSCNLSSQKTDICQWHQIIQDD